MADPWLPIEDRLVLEDPAAELLRVIGWRPGPAGVSAVELTPDLHVVVDHASPTTLTELAVTIPGRTLTAGVLDLLAALLGDDAADALLDVLRRPPSDRPTRLGASRRRGRDTGVGSDPFTDARHRRFATVALGADLADDATLSPTARAAALLEAALAAVDVHRPLAVDLARRGVTTLPPAAGSFGKQHLRLESLLRSVADATDLRPEADSTLERMRGSGPVQAAAGAARPMAAPAAAPRTAKAAPAEERFAAAAVVAADLAESAAPVDRPVEVEGAVRGWAWLDDGNNVRITAPTGASAGTWARVHRRHDRLLLGLSPIRDGDALVVIPPTDEADALVVDLVADPAQPRRAPAHDDVRTAIRTGRRAARLERLGDPAAAPAWSACADAWERQHDTQRVNVARRRPRPSTAAPLLADELD